MQSGMQERLNMQDYEDLLCMYGIPMPATYKAQKRLIGGGGAGEGDGYASDENGMYNDSEESGMYGEEEGLSLIHI